MQPVSETLQLRTALLPAALVNFASGDTVLAWTTQNGKLRPLKQAANRHPVMMECNGDGTPMPASRAHNMGA
jgi:hypothetical protein